MNLNDLKKVVGGRARIVEEIGAVSVKVPAWRVTRARAAIREIAPMNVACTVSRLTLWDHIVFWHVDARGV